VGADPRATRLRGVGGWLLLFCLSLTIFVPLATLRNAASSLGAASLAGSDSPGYAAAARITTILDVLVAAWGVYVGVQLWAVRRNAVRTAKRFLIASLAVAVASVPIWLLSGDEMAGLCTMVAGLQAGATGLYVAVWYSYLSKSRRVAATYSRLPAASQESQTS